MNYKEYLESEKWKAKARKKRQEAGMRCQICNSYGEIHVHHRTYKDIGNEDPRDLVALCKDCHLHFHKGNKPSTIDEAYEDGIFFAAYAIYEVLSHNRTMSTKARIAYFKLFDRGFSSKKIRRLFEAIRAASPEQINNGLKNIDDQYAQLSIDGDF